MVLAKAFSPSLGTSKVISISPQQSSFLGAVKVKEAYPPTFSSTSSAPQRVEVIADFDPVDSASSPLPSKTILGSGPSTFPLSTVVASTVGGLVPLLSLSEKADAAITMPKELMLSSGSFDPNTFVPVCAASDNLYRFLQGSAKTVVGAENFQEYGPLIASGLLRVRLELCVVESFFNEAVGPFIQQNGLSWVLPLHETVETFLAGTVFALATTFILVGSTKILTVLVTYFDFFIGAPLRLFGGFSYDRARGKPVTLDLGFGPFKTRVIGPKDLDVDKVDDWKVDLDDVGPAELGVIAVSGSAKAIGTGIKILRELLDAVDLFVGKSLVLWVTAYIGFKFLHFKVFPDFPPF